MSGNSWSGWGVSEIGPLHVKENIPNQDSYIVRKYSWGIVGVVCDGLGSKKYSHIGSKALVKAVTKTAHLFNFEKDLILFEPLLKSLWDIYIFPYSHNDTATTLLFTIIKDNKVYTGRVGDGAIVLLGDKDVVVDEDKDMFTNFTTPFGRDLKIEWEVYNEEDIDSIVLCSDGISEDIKNDSLLPFFNNYVETYKNKLPNKRNYEIKQWLKQWPVKGHTDDKTIVTLFKNK
jgi:serine/threonine protein phosphatase PrpC